MINELFRRRLTFWRLRPVGHQFDTAIAGSDAWSHVAARLQGLAGGGGGGNARALSPEYGRGDFKPARDGGAFGDEGFGTEASGLR